MGTQLQGVDLGAIILMFAIAIAAIPMSGGIDSVLNLFKTPPAPDEAPKSRGEPPWIVPPGG